MLEMNLSGLAETVAGEIRLHTNRGMPSGSADGSVAPHSTLIRELPSSRILRSLSGGEMARLVLSCGLASNPARLALDCTLEQLDSEARRHVLKDVLHPASRRIDVRIADNVDMDLADVADTHRQFEALAGVDLNGPLGQFARSLNGHSIDAPSIELERLCFRYPDSNRPILDGATFALHPGRPYLLKAPNGSGKSTLARLLLGVLRPDSGTISVNGAPLDKADRDKNLLFYAFQNPIAQVFSTSASAYLSQLESKARERDTWLRGSIDAEVAKVLEGFGLQTFSAEEPFELPFVALKRLSIAASLLSRSPWLFFDEPALSSDRIGRQALGSLFSTLCKIGFGIIIVSHGAEFDRLADACQLTIRDGQLMGAENGD
jgi:energy-coupling factor transporter ATP-binding protein EcfA2